MSLFQQKAMYQRWLIYQCSFYVWPLKSNGRTKVGASKRSAEKLQFSTQNSMSPTTETNGNGNMSTFSMRHSKNSCYQYINLCQTNVFYKLLTYRICIKYLRDVNEMFFFLISGFSIDGSLVALPDQAYEGLHDSYFVHAIWAWPLFRFRIRPA